MPPKKNATTGQSVKSKSSATMKQIDDLIGQSEVPDDAKNLELSQAQHEEKMKNMKSKYQSFNSSQSMKRNIQAISQMRLVITLCIGVATGILGFDGPLGIIFFFGMNLLVSCVLAVRFGFQAKPYFRDISQFFTTGATANFMTFMVTWVLFHNLVYIL